MAKTNGKTTVEEQILAELKTGFAGVNERLDHLISNTGEHWREHERRLRAIEEKLGLAH